MATPSRTHPAQQALRPHGAWRRVRRAALAALTLACGAAFLFFSVGGVRVLWTAATFRGEGSLGHVGMYIGAVLFPLLAILFGGLTWLSLRAWRHSAAPAEHGRREE